MIRRRPWFLTAFLLGIVVFAWAYYMIQQRDPVVITTEFHMEPNVGVKPRQRLYAVWTDETLRAGCGGELMRQFTGTKNGRPAKWVFPPTSTVNHGVVGSKETFYTPWRAPNGDPGTKAVFRKGVKRWCNFFQWFFPMHEIQEAEFTFQENEHDR